MKPQPETRAGIFIRENLTSPVVALATRRDGRLSYRLENGMRFLLDDAGVETLNRYSWTPRLSEPLRERLDAGR